MAGTELVCWRTTSGTESADSAFSESVPDARFACNDPGWSFQPQKAPSGISWDANMCLSWSKHKGQNFHGCFLQQRVAILHPPPSKVSQWVGIAKSRRGEQKDGFSGSNVLKVTSASRWLAESQNHLSQVRAIERRGKGYSILSACSRISFQVTLSSCSGTGPVSTGHPRKENQLGSLSAQQPGLPWGSSLHWDHL